jgi:pyruvate-ferredoxin/flavodoxin oxidoreductase
MWFSKKAADPKAPHPGTICARDGLQTAAAASALCADQVLVDAGLRLPVSREPGVTDVRPDQIPGRIAGLAATGLRTAAVVGEVDALGNSFSMLTGRRLACVFNLAPRARNRQAHAIQGSHDACHAVADLGPFQLQASNVQQVADLSLIAHRIAELSLTPGVCFQDRHATGLSVQQLRMPDRALASAYLGGSGDAIDTPTPAQQMLFGQQRRRLPRLLDPDNPAGLGGFQDHDSFAMALAAQQAFFADHLAALVEQAMSEYTQLTGREYQPLSSYRMDDAQVAVVCMGAIHDLLIKAVDQLRESQGIKVGLVGVTVLRPFPGAQLSHLLKGKRIVTVLERSDAPLAEDPPLLRELRAALDKAAENGAGKETPLHPGYASFEKPAHRPRLCSGSYAVGSALPRPEQLAGVISNMAAAEPVRRFHIGVNFDPEQRRFPQLEVVKQELNQAYPHLKALTLPEGEPLAEVFAGQVMRLHAAAGQSGVQAGNLIARTLARTPDCLVRSEPSSSCEGSFRPAHLTLAFGPEPIRGCPSRADTVLVSDEALLDSLVDQSTVVGGRLVIATAHGAETLWQGLSRKVEDWIRSHELKLYLVDARPGLTSEVSEAAAPPAWTDQWSVWALLAAGIQLHDPARADACQDQLAILLSEELGADETVVAEILHCFESGRQPKEVDWQQWKDLPREPQAELQAPWTAGEADPSCPRLYDTTEFWHSVGYLHDSGELRHVLPDPRLATGMMPAGSSAHRNLSAHRFRTPVWLAENCTGCGQCWALCPDSALPAGAHTVAEWLDTATAALKAQGKGLTQMNRISGHLVKMANQVVRKDDLKQHRHAAAILVTAFDQLMEKMGLEGDALEAMRSDFDLLRDAIGEMPAARTEAYFDRPDQQQKDQGRLLTIPFNPSACKGCGLCIANCPENAFDWRQYNAAQEQTDRGNWAFRMALPDSPLLLPDSETSTRELGRLLNRDVYHALVGGDGASPASGTKIAVHLLTAAVESVMRQRYQQHADYLGDLLERLRACIQGEVAGSVEINDFTEFAHRLEQVSGNLDRDSLTGLFEDNADEPDQIDPERLKRMGRLLHELEAQHATYANGRRSRLLLALDPDQIAHWSGHYPDNPHTSPWISQGTGDTLALAEGMFDGVARLLTRELACCRLAEVEIKGGFDSHDHLELRDNLRWQDLSADELMLVPRVLMIAPADGVAWRELRQLLEGNKPITIALLDESGPGCGDGLTDDHAMLALAAGRVPILQSSIGNPAQLLAGTVACLDSTAAALIQVHCPEPELCGIAPEQVARDARLAINSRAVPLFHFDPREKVLNLEDNPEPDSDWAVRELQVRDPSGSISGVKTVLTVADWAVGQRSLRGHFRVIARGHVTAAMKPLAEYLVLGTDERDSVEPYIDLTDGQQRHFVATVSPAMVELAESRLARWRQLRSAVDSQPIHDEKPESGVSSPKESGLEPGPAAAVSADAHQALTEQLLKLCGYGAGSEFENQSLKRFLESRRSTDDAVEPE